MSRSLLEIGDRVEYLRFKTIWFGNHIIYSPPPKFIGNIREFDFVDSRRFKLDNWYLGRIRIRGEFRELSFHETEVKFRRPIKTKKL